jgi:hypothetical protein
MKGRLPLWCEVRTGERLAGPVPEASVLPDELRAAIVLFFSLLDEKQRRCMQDSRPSRQGEGAMPVSRICSVSTRVPSPEVAGSCSAARSRSVGSAPRDADARRWKKTPDVIDRIAELMKHETAGDPMSGLKWTRRTRQKVCSELRQIGIRVSPNTVGLLLRRMGYSLRVNHKKVVPRARRRLTFETSSF